MTRPNEGVIKFKYNLKMAPAIEEQFYIKLEKWRAILYKMNFIGEYPSEKIGFGNLSQRIISGEDTFIITGTQTGKYPHLDGTKYTKVVKCDIAKMTMDAIGPIAPSSESLTHHGIYNFNSNINAIFHVHHHDLWNYMLNNKFDKTAKNIQYGTTEMAQAVNSCIKNKNNGIFAMAGHQDGIISYGTTPQEAGKILLDTLKESKN